LRNFTSIILLVLKNILPLLNLYILVANCKLAVALNWIYF